MSYSENHGSLTTTQTSIGAQISSLLIPTQGMAAEIYLSSASLEDIRKALEPKALIDPATRVPHHYHEFLKVFDQSEADKLPPSPRL